MNSDNDNSVRIIIQRNQDGTNEINEYFGKAREFNDRLHITFSDMQEDGSSTQHLLKIGSDHMEWIRSGNYGKSKTAFKAGESLPFLFNTPHGDINMQLVTDSFTYTKKDTLVVSVSYFIMQGDEICSRYNTSIEIIIL